MEREKGNRAASGRRIEVLRVLKDASGSLSINDIAGQLSVHPNTVRFHLETLVESGQVERVEADRRTAGRPPQLFRPVQGMDPTGPRHYQVLAEVLIIGLGTEPDRSTMAAEAGRAWGRRRGLSSSAGDAGGPDGADGADGSHGPGDSVARLIGLLDEIGFVPERREGSEVSPQIGLRHCPFLELAETRSEIVCPVHLGLMQGAMEAWRSPVTVDRLEPFVEPDLCLAHLTT